jgi:RIO kinase 1
MDDYGGPEITSKSAQNSLQSALKKQAAAAHTGSKSGDRALRSTIDSALDPRTRLMLLRLINSGKLSRVDGIVSTGKEANVYYAEGSLAYFEGRRAGKGTPVTTDTPWLTEDDRTAGTMRLAVKVFKTSVLSFKDRQKYVAGEWRFRGGFARASNPRRMVKTWAEKEGRNLLRLAHGGVPAPRLRGLVAHVLLMDFLGDGDVPLPRLKDVVLKKSQWRASYYQLVLAMRTMFQDCRLVHADLSEYNVLARGSDIYIIDVGQAVEHDHPNALHFLRADCTNITAFYSAPSRVPNAMGARRLFDFVTDVTIRDVDEWLEEEMSREREEDEDEDGSWLNAYIPRTLSDVVDPERDIFEVEDGDERVDAYKAIAGLPREAQSALEALRIADEEDEDDEDEDDEGGDGDDGGDEANVDGDDEDGDGEPLSRKDAKKAFKAAQAAKRAERKAAGHTKAQKKRREKKR